MKKKLILVLAILVGTAWGQAFYQLPSPHPGASISVCPVGATANPCPSPVSIFQDQALSIPIVQPFSIGPTGQFGFWVAPGQYVVQLRSTDYTSSYIISLGGSGSGGTTSTGLDISAATFSGNWGVRVNAAAALLPSGGTIIIPDSVAGDASGTTITVPSNVTLQFTGSADFTECTMNVGGFTKIYMNGARLKLNGSGCKGINLTTLDLFQANDKFILRGVRVACQSQTNSTGIFLGNFTAQVATYNVSVQDCTTADVQMDGAQFSENYNMNLGNVTANPALIIHSVTGGGGGNSNTFYGLKVWSSAVGVLIYADTSIGQGANYFVNPSILGATTTGLCVFGNTTSTDVHWYGGAPELTGGGTSTIVVNGKTCKQASIYANLASVQLVDISIADATTNPWAIAENGSHFSFTNGGGYGNTTGVLVSADSTSVTSVDGMWQHLGTLQNVVAYPSTFQFQNFSKMYGAPILQYTTTVPNVFTGNPQTPAFSDINGASSQTTATDALYGLVNTVTFAASAGTKDSNRFIFNPSIAALGATSDVLQSFLLKASANTVVACGDYNQNNSFANITLTTGRWTRVLLYEGAIASGQNVLLVCNSTDSVGATISITGVEALTGASNTAGVQQAMNTVLVSGAVNPLGFTGVFDCTTTTACAKTLLKSPIIVRGDVTFPTATTVSLSSLPFTSSTSYSCTASDLTTAAGVVNATTYTSGSAVTFTETNGTNVDHARYICTGF